MPTPLRLAAILSLLLLLPFSAHSRASVRYFAIWSYVENAPAEEIPESSLAGRSLGYWELHFDPEGGVIEGVYRNGGGSPWLVLRYVEDAEKIYADLYLPDGSFIVRKSTRLTSRAPSWPEPAS